MVSAMGWIFSALLLGIAIWVMANLRAPYPAVPLVIGLFLLWIAILTGLSLLLVVSATLVAAIVLLLASPRLRKRLVSAPLLKQFRRVLPPMSETEEVAIHAGTVWWDAELFKGRPKWDKLLSQPAPELTNREREFLDGPVEKLCGMLNDWSITHEEKGLPAEIWDYIRGERFFGMTIPRRYGGLGFSALAHSAVVMKLSSRSIAAAVTVMVPNSLGPAKLLLHYGTGQQRDHYLPRLASGDEIPCFALTGPQAGSDAGAIPDRGVVCYRTVDGSKTLGILLNWEKRYITLGPVATLIGLAFKLEDPDLLLGDDPSPGITLALIPRETPGVSIGKRHIPLDIPFQNGPIFGCDVFIPIEAVIGGRDGVGRGWSMLVESLSEGRGISLPALATGAGKLACRFTGAYARIRQQFNTPIGRFEGVEAVLARIAGLTYQMDAARLLTLGAIDSGENPSVISAIVKYHLTERYRQIINDAMDIQGGSGICLGPGNILGRMYQAIPISITVEGANILTRSMIIFGQGAIRCHPYILDELRATGESDLDQALDLFDKSLFRHVSYIIGNMTHSLLLGLVRGRVSSTPLTGPTRRYFQHLNWMSAGFALCADMVMITMGGTLKRKELLSARLGDILSELYLASSVLKHFRDQGSKNEDLPLLEWACEHSLYRIQEAFRALLRNLPFIPLRWLLRLLVFPTGYPYTAPCDSLGHKVAELLLSPSASRERLTAGIYVNKNSAEKIGQLELAMEQADAVEQIEGTLRGALKSGLIKSLSLQELVQQAVSQGILSTVEQHDFETMERLRKKVIQVDSFDDYGKPLRVRPATDDLGHSTDEPD